MSHSPTVIVICSELYRLPRFVDQLPKNTQCLAFDGGCCSLRKNPEPLLAKLQQLADHGSPVSHVVLVNHLNCRGFVEPSVTKHYQALFCVAERLEQSFRHLRVDTQLLKDQTVALTPQ